MASQGPRYPATTASLANAGSSENAEAWVNPSGITTDNATEASITAASYDSPDISQLLVASNFGFAIPTGATINGIVVEVDRRDGGIGAASDNRVQLATGTTFATLVGNNKADTALDWPTASTVKTYGTSSDTWAAGLTVAQINAAGFAVMLSVQADAANTDVFVDFVRVTVHYTPPTGDNAYEDAILADAPVFVATMEEASGNLADLITGKTGTANGTPTYGSAGPISGKTAIDFAAVTDFFDFADHIDLDLGDGPFSIELWFRRDDDTGALSTLLHKGTNGYMVILTAADQMTLDKVGLAGFLVGETATTPADGVWHHWVITRSAAGAGNTLIYKDAVEGHTDSQPTVALADTTAVLRLGQEAASNRVGGALAYIALYKSVLSSTRITAHYNAASGASLARTTTDALAAADAIIRAFAGARATSDARGQSDSASRTFAGSRATTDSVTLADVATQAKTLIRSVAEALGLADAATRAGAFLRSTTDSSARADAASRTGSFIRATTDAVTQSDVAAGVRSLIRSATDAVTHSDVGTRTANLLRAVTDASARADAVTRVGNFLRSAADGITWADVVTAAKSGSQVVRTAADAIGLTDAVTRTGNFIRSTTEGVTQSDVATRAVARIRTTTEALGLADAATRTLGLVRSATDTATYADAASRAVAFVRTAADAAGLSDAAVAVVTGAVTIGTAVISLAERIAAALGLTARYAASMTLSLRHEAALSVVTEYDLNDTASPSVTFTVDGAATDPTTITLTVIPPDKSTATYTYAGGTVTKSSTGVYTKNITLNQRGVWYLQFAGTGACQATAEATLRVRA